MSDASPVAQSKDLEGVSDAFEQGDAPPPAAASASAKPTKQRKIAVLTSGGDSAGMNAAGMFRRSTGCYYDKDLRLMTSPSCRPSRYRTWMPDIHHPRRMGRTRPWKH